MTLAITQRRPAAGFDTLRRADWLTSQRARTYGWLLLAVTLT